MSLNYTRRRSVRIDDAVSIYEPDVTTSTQTTMSPALATRWGKKPVVTSMYSMNNSSVPYTIESTKFVRSSPRYDASKKFSSMNSTSSSSIREGQQQHQQQHVFFLNKLFRTISPRTPANSFRRNRSSHTNTTEGEHSICETSTTSNNVMGHLVTIVPFSSPVTEVPSNSNIHHKCHNESNKNVVTTIRTPVAAPTGIDRFHSSRSQNNNTNYDTFLAERSLKSSRNNPTTYDVPINSTAPMSMAMPPSPFLKTKKYQQQHQKMGQHQREQQSRVSNSSAAPPERRKFFLEKLITMSKMHVNESRKVIESESTSFKSPSIYSKSAPTTSSPDSGVMTPKNNNASNIFKTTFSGNDGRRLTRRTRKNIGPRITYSMDTNSSVGVTDDEDINDISFFSALSPTTVLQTVQHQPRIPIVSNEPTLRTAITVVTEAPEIQQQQELETHANPLEISPNSNIEHETASLRDTNNPSTSNTNMKTSISTSLFVCGSSNKEREASQTEEKQRDNDDASALPSLSSIASLQNAFERITQRTSTDETPTNNDHHSYCVSLNLATTNTTKGQEQVQQVQKKQKAATPSKSLPSSSSSLEWKQYFGTVLDNVTKIQFISKCSNIDIVRCGDDDDNVVYQNKRSTAFDIQNKDNCSVIDIGNVTSTTTDLDVLGSNNNSIYSEEDEDDVATYDDSLLSTSLFDESLIEDSEEQTYTTYEEEDNTTLDDYDTDYVRYYNRHRLNNNNINKNIMNKNNNTNHYNYAQNSLLDTTPSQQTDDTSYSSQNSAWL